MKPYENNITPLIVKSRLPLYTTTETPNGIIPHDVHTILDGHLPGNPMMNYTIVDEYKLVNQTGTQELSFRPITPTELQDLMKLPTTSQWYDPKVNVYMTQHPIKIDEYFRVTDWPRTLTHWVTEGLDKDPRLVDSFKSLVIPLTGDPPRIQPLNAHAIWNTNTGPGKSFYAFLLGSEPYIGPTEAGALGSYNQTKYGTQVTPGFLHGEGFPILLDEMNTNDKPLIQKLLTYLENGQVTRALKESILVKGTKTVILTGNPSSDDMTSSLVDFIRVVCTADEPARVGRRFGFLLLGDDYKRVQGDGDATLRDEVRRVIETVIHQYGDHIKSMMESQLDWIMAPEPQIEQEIRDYADAIPIRIALEFVRGQSYGCVKKLKMAAIRYIILEQLNRVPDDTVDFTDRDRVFQRLLDINRDSWKKLALIKPPNISDKQWARELKAQHPSLSLRDIEKVTGHSHTTIRNWIKDDKTNETQLESPHCTV